MSSSPGRKRWWSAWRWLGERRAESQRRRWSLALPTALFLGIALFVSADLVDDVRSGMGAMHLLVEAGAVILCLAGVVANGRELWREVERSRRLTIDLDSARTELARSQAEAEAILRGLGSVIDRQLQAWALSSAECEVALLILKGLSYKQIAQLRATSERTVRHQAIAIFHKAGLSGRAEMAAFFLEDLLAPSDEQRARQEPGPIRELEVVRPASTR